MALIYQKTISDKCLVLDSRESAWFPLKCGAWTGLEIGVLFSLTSSSDHNAPYSNESIEYSNPYDGIFFGIKDTGFYLPLESGHFIGLTSAPSFGGTSTINGTNALYGSGFALYSIASSGASYAEIGIHSGFHLASPNASTGSTGFASFIGLKFEVTGIGTNGQSIRVLSSNDYFNAGTNDTSTAFLRGKLTAFPEHVSTTSYSYFTTGFVDGGGPLPIPEAFYVYMPFTQNRFRLHAIMATNLTV